MTTKLTTEQLTKMCNEQGVRPTQSNLAYMAFFNDAEFREQVTNLMFERAIVAAQDREYSDISDELGGLNRFGV